MSFIQAGRCQIPYKAVIDAPFYLDTPAPEPKVTSASTMRSSTSHTSFPEVQPLRLPLKPQEQQAVAQVLKHIYADLESLDSTIKQQFQTCENYGLETVSALWPIPEKHAQIEALLHHQVTTTCQNLLKKGLMTADIQKKCEPSVAALLKLFTAHHLQIMKAEYDVSTTTQLLEDLLTTLFGNADEKIDNKKNLGDFPTLFLAKTLQASPVGLMMYAAYCKGDAYLSLKQQCEKIALSSYSSNQHQNKSTTDQRRAAQLFLKVLEYGQSSRASLQFKWFNEQHQVIGLSPASAGINTIPALGGAASCLTNNLSPMLFGIQDVLKSSIEAKACSIRGQAAKSLVKQLASTTPDYKNLLESHQQAFQQEQGFLDRFLHIPQHIQTFLEEAYAQQYKSVEQQYKKEEMPGVKLVEGASFQNDAYIRLQRELFDSNPLERIRLLGLEMAPSILRPYFDRYDCIKHVEGLNYQRTDGSSFMTFAQAQNSGFITTHCHPQALEQLGFAQNYDEFNNSDLDYALMHHNNEVLSKPVYLPGLTPPPEQQEQSREPEQAQHSFAQYLSSKLKKSASAQPEQELVSFRYDSFTPSAQNATSRHKDNGNISSAKITTPSDSNKSENSVAKYYSSLLEGKVTFEPLKYSNLEKHQIEAQELLLQNIKAEKIKPEEIPHETLFQIIRNPISIAKNQVVMLLLQKVKNNTLNEDISNNLTNHNIKQTSATQRFITNVLEGKKTSEPITFSYLEPDLEFNDLLTQLEHKIYKKLEKLKAQSAASHFADDVANKYIQTQNEPAFLTDTNVFFIKYNRDNITHLVTNVNLWENASQLVRSRLIELTQLLFERNHYTTAELKVLKPFMNVRSEYQQRYKTESIENFKRTFDMKFAKTPKMIKASLYVSLKPFTESYFSHKSKLEAKKIFQNEYRN